MTDPSSKISSRIGRTLVIVLAAILVSLVIVVFGSKHEASAALLSDATIRQFCDIDPPPSGTKYGYYDLMYINNGNTNQTVVITDPTQTTANITFKIETWFCRLRNAAIDTHSYKIVEQGSSTDLVTWKSSSSWSLDSRINSSSYSPWPPADRSIDHIAPNDSHTANIDGHKLMSTPTISATIDISDWNDGETKRLCPQHDVKSYYSVSWDTPVTPRCINFTIRYDFPWALEATSEVDKTTANVGEKVTWTHTLVNDGPGETDLAISSSIGTTANFSNSWGANIGSVDTPDSPGITKDGSVRSFSSTDTEYVIQPGDAGEELCQRVEYSPAGSGGGSGQTAWACVKVQYNFTLTPDVAPLPTSTASAGEPVTVQSNVTNQGGSVSKDTEWQMTKVLVPSGGSIPNQAGGISAQSPCGTYFSPAAPGSCSTIASGTRVFPTNGFSGAGVPFPGLNTAVPNVTNNLGDLAAGTRVCFGLSVRPYSHVNDTDWRHSDLKCLTIVKNPKVQVWGNDLRVGSGFSTGSEKASSIAGIIVRGADSKYYGSWGEYGVLAPGSITGFASGSGFATGNTSALQSDWSALTFANTPSYGQYATAAQFGLLPNIEFYVDGSRPGGFKFDHVSNVSSISTWPSGAKSVLVRNIGGTVTIAGDILRPSTYDEVDVDTSTVVTHTVDDVEDLPQMIIIADRIIIRDNVNRVDAWLVGQGGNGVVQTCQTTVALTVNMCNQPLTVNGPIIANRLLLARTYGADTSASIGVPAERLNLPADTYMWVWHQRELQGSLQTIYTRELPPRY